MRNGVYHRTPFGRVGLGAPRIRGPSRSVINDMRHSIQAFLKVHWQTVPNE